MQERKPDEVVRITEEKTACQIVPASLRVKRKMGYIQRTYSRIERIVEHVVINRTDDNEWNIWNSVERTRIEIG